jgi:DNA-binding response OmpR family regulator
MQRILNSSSGSRRAGAGAPARARIAHIPEMPMNILLVEDDAKAARLLARGLQEEGFLVTVAPSAEAVNPAGLDCDLVLLDWMLPGKDGTALCRELRSAGLRVPVLMLTARDAVADRIAGLDTGADDYLTKPFVFDELLARIRALLRRAELAYEVAAGQPGPLVAGELALHPLTREVSRAGAALDLTPKEYAILEILMRHAGQVVSRQQLAEQVWHADLIAIDNLMDVHMKNLRRKVDAPGQSPLVHTVRAQGFRLGEAEAGDA